MKTPFKAKVYLTLFVILTVGLLCACANPATPATPPDNSSEPPSVSQVPSEPTNTPDRVDVVYFHQKNPCHCMAVIGDNINKTVFFNFVNELGSGKLTFKMIVSDDKANADMVRKYNTGLFGLFITIVKGETERIVPVEEIWSMTGDEAKYEEYIKNIIAKSLNGEL